MSKIAFIYPGQGAQKAGMGADFYENSRTAAAVFDEASQLLNLDMKALCFEENERLDVTEYTQAAMVTTCLAMTKVLEERGIRPDLTAGLSLGEYAAIAAAGGMETLDAVRLVRKRGILMQHTVPEGEGAMCAVLAMEAEQIEHILEGIEGADIANYNCPGQIVITGQKAAVQEAARQLKKAGAKRTVMLNVSGPFHSPLLRPAGEALQKELEHTELKPLSVPYVTNVDASLVSDIGRTRELLIRQISSPVRWEQSVRRMLEEGVDTFIEIGPGKTLAGFLRKIHQGAAVYNINTWEDVEGVKSRC